MPMQVCPALLIAPHTAASAAAATSASSATIIASLPPSSRSTGVRVSAQAAMTRRPVGAEPVKASLPTPARHSAARSEEHTSELQSRQYLVCRLLLEKKKHKLKSQTSRP